VTPGPGARIGPYRIVRALGRGGTSAVFEARDDVSGRSVALKLLLPEVAHDAELVARARQEARALERLAHPGIIRVEAVGEHDGAPWLALELLPGGTLGSRLREAGALAWPDAIAAGAAIARALAHVHAAGLVHRDVKPANVFLDQAGKPKLGDFGFVRVATGGGGLTRSGESLGTAEYLAPEQVDAAKHAGPAADLYSLGATLYALIAGAPPFAGLPR
jgi:serine/threonine protein kinase